MMLNHVANNAMISVFGVWILNFVLGSYWVKYSSKVDK